MRTFGPKFYDAGYWTTLLWSGWLFNARDKMTRVDTPIYDAMMFRLIFGTQDDHYEPEVARYVTDAIAALDDKSAATTITIATYNVRLDLN